MTDGTIWGHSEVHVSKDTARRLWVVSTVNNDPRMRLLLVEVPWADAFKSFPHAPDYAVAVATCQSSDEALTEEEEELILSQPLPATAMHTYERPLTEPPPKVISLADFRRKKR